MIFRSPYPEVAIPETALTPFVFEHALRRGDKPAVIDAATGQTFTYAQLHGAVRRAAAGFRARGYAKGDVLAILSPNVPEYAVAFHGAALAGLTATTVNPLCTAEEVAKQLKDARARALVAHPSLLDKAAEAARAAGVGELFVFGDDAAGSAEPFALLYEREGDAPAAGVDPRKDVVALPYSSGTTGLPKGVMLTHRNLVANLRQIELLDIMRADDTALCVLPLFHIYGLAVIMNLSLRVGATVVMMPRFDFAEYLTNLERYGVTVAHVVPPIVLALAKQPAVEGRDLSRLRLLFSGAAPLGAELTRACSQKLGCAVRQGYGMTETSPATHMTPAEAADSKPGSVGTCVPNTESKIVDAETGEELGAGAEGEICVRGPQVMKGYLNCPEETARTVDAEGWLHTGDIGYAEADGHFFVVDRAKELIKYKGFQVAPAELESLLLTHPAVADAAVVPFADDEAGEIPKAFVVLKPDSPLAPADAPAELMGYVAARVAPHKKIRRVELTGQIPKSPSGKILRRLLVAREREGRGGA
ncbi:MAG TPA: 4-coumarate--CoA ligase family protein [Pyrinomonadaceae bacterium]|nr:4-coumarate--CoA ligase family protein [Pyrinomonadaceae bacterium]